MTALFQYMTCFPDILQDTDSLLIVVWCSRAGGLINKNLLRGCYMDIKIVNQILQYIEAIQ